MLNIAIASHWQAVSPQNYGYRLCMHIPEAACMSRPTALELMQCNSCQQSLISAYEKHMCRQHHMFWSLHEYVLAVINV